MKNNSLFLSVVTYFHICMKIITRSIFLKIIDRSWVDDK